MDRCELKGGGKLICPAKKNTKILLYQGLPLGEVKQIYMRKTERSKIIKKSTILRKEHKMIKINHVIFRGSKSTRSCFARACIEIEDPSLWSVRFLFEQAQISRVSSCSDRNEGTSCSLM